MSTLAPPETRRILLVDADVPGRSMLSGIIESGSLGKVLHAGDGLEGLNKCFEERPDVVVINLDLPRLDGLELLRMIRSSTRGRTLPIIMSADARATLRRGINIHHTGADHCLWKPYRPETLLNQLNDFFANLEESQTAAGDGGDSPRDSSGFIAKQLFKTLDESDRDSALRRPEFDGHPVKFNSFRLLERIGRGGMGVVYRARQESLGRTVAIKVLSKHRADAPTAIERFQKEIRIMARLAHRNIVHVIDAGETERTVYIVVEYINGGTLHGLQRRGPISLRDFAPLAWQTCNAVIYLHGEGVIHRDLKPGNIMLTSDDTVKVTDFGISTMRSERKKAGMPRIIEGTPLFMAPEVLAGVQQPSEYSDQYALAKTLLHLLLPKGEKLEARRLRAARPDTPSQLAAVLARAGSEEPSRRFPSIAHLKAELQDILA